VNRRHFIATASAAAVWLAAACSDKSPDPAAANAAPPPPAAQKSPRDTYEAAAKASGFSVGSMMAANTVYVFFDPTCPHCAALWMNSKTLANKLKIVWIPVGWLQRQSGPQGATILSAHDPAAAMNENESSVIEHKGGITVNPSLKDDVLAKVKANTDLFNTMGADSVPYIVFKNARTGVYGTHAGAVSADELMAMVGLGS